MKATVVNAQSRRDRRAQALRRGSAWRQPIAGGIAVLLIVTLAGGVPELETTAAAYQSPQPQADASVPGSNASGGVGLEAKGTGVPFDAPAPVWPAAGSADLAVATAGRVAARPGLPVWAEPVGAMPAARRALRLEVLDRQQTVKSGVDGLLLRVGPTGGRVRLGVDYSGFRYAYGADWASRLRLVVLPDGTPLPSRNDAHAGVVSAEIDTPASTLVAVTAAPSGAAGDYAATSLAPSSVWEAGGNAGSFSWSYPMRVPPGLRGPEPDLSLAYSSSSVDGRMAASNNQPSVAGEGFDFNPGGFIERRYVPCRKDGGNGASAGTNSGDLCWRTDNATMSLNGRSTELLKASDGTWHGRAEDGSRIERRTGLANGDDDGEHWIVTTTDGTQYWFGRNRLPGWATNKPETNSTWTVPVYGNGANDPCHATQVCMQAWRWNLDFVVDPFGNSMSYWYTPETNKYARNMSATAPVDYTRGGYLTQIDYGTRGTTAYGTPPMRVLLGNVDRCSSGCTTHDAAHWPDTPWDQQCTGSPCYVGSPTFWTTRRLSTVTTRVWKGTGTDYRDVESWTLAHSFPNPGDGTRAGLWLDRISHAGGTTTVPDITFTGVQLANRVDTTDFAPPMNWWRIAYINTEAGGRVGVTYKTPDCVRGSSMPSTPETNTLRCYPVRWTPEGYSAAITDYFHRYVVESVTETDLALPSDGRSPRTITSYDYLSDPAWHYTDDDGLIQEEDKTWSVWRGYARVRVSKGDAADRTRTETLYFRGMHGDKLPLPAGSRSVTVQASEGAAVTDENAYAGLPRETLTYNGPSGALVEATISDAWQSAATATRTIGGLTAQARFVRTAAKRTRIALDGGRGFRRTTSTYAFDAYGMQVKEENLGDDGPSGDEQCTLTTYVRNATAWLMNYPSRAQKLGLTCAAAAGTLTAADIISDEYTSYDQQARGVAPAFGAESRTEELASLPATYVTTTRATHDDNGRVKQSWDVRGNLITTARTQAGGGPVTATTETTKINQVDWVTTTSLDPAWGVTTAVIDPNGRRTDLTYDGLGRLTGVWRPGRNKAAGQSASTTYAYLVRTNGPTVVTTATLTAKEVYATNHSLYDAQLRPRQTQAPDVPVAGAPQGRVLTDTFYDTAGRVVKTNDRYVADGVPTTSLFLPLPDAQIPAQTRTTYDGAGRTATSSFLVNGVAKWHTTTGYGGDRTDVTAPVGGTATSTVVDAYGRRTALRQFRGATLTGTPDVTSYTYDRKGQLTRVADAVGNRWDYTYDLRGRQSTADDPDKGFSTSTYNDAGDELSTTDARGVVLAYTYDSLGRKTSMRDDSASGPKRAEWTYDTLTSGTSVKGQPVKAIRWVGTGAYVTEVTGYTATYQPSGRTITIPATAATTGVHGSYTYGYSYNVDGTPASTRQPAAGGMAAETLKYGFDNLGNPTTLSTTLSGTGDDVFYVNGTAYTRFGEVGVVGRRFENGKVVDTGRYYEVGTRRLNRILTTRETNPSLVADVNLAYDPAGNVTRIADGADSQCFRYDGLRRLTEAWTPSGGDCGPAPAQAALGGPAPYWQSFSYDPIGNRLTAVNRTATTNTTSTYAYPATGADRPHAVTSVQTGSSTAAYTYDAAGNTLTRPAGGGTQTSTWDREGHLATSTDASGTTSYTYDADGNRLLRVDPAGRTLYLPDQEVRHTTSGAALSCVRYYTHAGQTIGMRTAAGVTWLVDDHQGTDIAAVTASTQAVTLRRQKPFGESRGTPPVWPSSKGFVDGTTDNTGLGHLGAREYDAALGRFASVDPVLVADDPQQIHAYAYAANTPVTASDPSGLMLPMTEGTSTCNSGIMYADIYCERARSGSSGGSGKPNAGNGGKRGPEVRAGNRGPQGRAGNRGGTPHHDAPRMPGSTKVGMMALMAVGSLRLDVADIGQCVKEGILCAMKHFDRGTVGICAGANWAIVGNFGAEVCVQSDKRGVFFTKTIMEPKSPNRSFGLGAGIGIGVQASDAKDKNSLAGPAKYGSGGRGLGSVSYSAATDANGEHVHVYEVGLAKASLGGHGGWSDTVVSGRIFDWCGARPCHFFHANG